MSGHLHKFSIILYSSLTELLRKIQDVGFQYTHIEY
ncbi:hypothetical protein pb186bvf_009872 [Paramecium bursaria]